MRMHLSISQMLVLLALFCSNALAQRDGTFHLSAHSVNNRAVWINEYWRYHSGDNEEWAKPELDDSAWEIAATALDADNLPKGGWKEVGWFRLRLTVDSTLIDKPIGLRMWQTGVSQLYLDGRLLYHFDNSHSVSAAHANHKTETPKVITFDNRRTHVMAIRYAIPSVEKYHRAGFEAGFYLQLGDPEFMIASRLHDVKTFTTYQMIFTSLSLTIGLLHLILFLFFPNAKQNLYFSLFIFFYAAAVYFDYQNSLQGYLEPPLLYMRAHRAVMIPFIILGLRFAYSLLCEKLPKAFWLISAVLVFLGAFAVYKPGENFIYFGFGSFLVFGEIVRVMIAVRMKRSSRAGSTASSNRKSEFPQTKETWIVGLAFILLLVFFSFDALMDLGYNVPFREMENPYAFGTIGFFIAMSIYLSRDFARTNKRVAEQELEQQLLEAENTRKTKELNDARQLQLSMLPKCVNDIPGIDICFYMQPATEVGGDYYDYHLSEDGTLTIAIGDATGHGMKAGTMVSIIKSLFIAHADQSDISEFLEKCARTIRQMRLGNLYMALLLIKIKNHNMTIASAGMPPVYIYRSATKRVEEIVIKAMPLGGPAPPSFETVEASLKPGDAVLLMSDGFPELFNDKEEMLDYARVNTIFKQAAAKTADELVEHLIAAGEKWRNGRPQDDDITFVALKAKEIC